MIRYHVGGRWAAPSAGSEPYAVFWNASTTEQIYVQRLVIENDHATIAANIGIQRVSTRGTAGSTVTPDIDNHAGREVAPGSGVLLDLADFTVLPTFQGPRWTRPIITPRGGSLELRFGDRRGKGGLAVPQSTGLLIEVASGLATGSLTVEWLE